MTGAAPIAVILNEVKNLSSHYRIAQILRKKCFEEFLRMTGRASIPVILNEVKNLSSHYRIAQILREKCFEEFLRMTGRAPIAVILNPSALLRMNSVKNLGLR